MIRDRKKKSIDRFFSLSPHIRWALLALIVAIFATGLYPGLVIKKHRYAIGDVAKTDIKAEEDFFIEDKAATEANRRKAVDGVATVHDLNPKILKGTVDRLTEAFDRLRAIYEKEASQLETNWRTSPVPLPTPDDAPVDPDDVPDLPRVPLKERMLAHKGLFEDLFGAPISNGAFSILTEHGFSQDIARLLTTIITQVLSTGVVANKEILLRESEKGITLRNLETLTETHVLNLKQFYGPDQAKTMVRVVGDPILKGKNYALLNLIVDFSQRMIQPNITANSHETEARKKAAAEKIKPVLYMIKKGEMLLREGERVTALQIRKLNAVEDQADAHRVPLAGSGAVALLTAILIIQYQVRLKGRMESANYANKDLLFLSCIMVAFIIVVKISTTLPDAWFLGMALSHPVSPVGFGIPLAAGAMIVCLFMGRETALIFALALALCASMLLQGSLETFIFFILSCTMASWWLQDCRERKIIIKTGAKLGVLNAFLAVVIDVYLGTASWATLPFDVTIAFLGGIGAGIITAGMAPVVEMVFRYTTDITLLELANLDQPILRRLMLEAPGTYHHSVVVGSLVEAAATEIGANPILAKVCGYYHDIGKLKQPLYFIENQANGRNKHDKLAPSMSALILIAHVKNGVEIARDHKLGQSIIDTIQQHHGSSLISYFFEKAKTVKGADAVNIDDFRYPGPRPQTREAGLVMLADIVEAASRTLENPTPSRIQGLVQNLINKVFSDGQLDHCELTLKDLHLIARSFNKILNGIHHHRIEYQDSASITSGKAKNGSVDRKPAKPPQAVRTKNPDDRQAHFKRLGLS
ncbi:HD family phosphohydrolase [Desulfosarcina alkanivorans]|uniref:HD family phosphohydrolase n=1 Tax=Desulfosarcina alkanivorans TaxID=571177 RepID=A0A5K7YSD3_9BACT|nr:HDIG domain-containing metalloprotein [Desulfosarcina alkanivorans]BBO67557.1 HD family phosphohydrolase [Desulfosarcina alkanivorans]